MISKDVPTHWNSSAVMMNSALPLQQALNMLVLNYAPKVHKNGFEKNKMLVLKTVFNKPKGVHLQRYQLSASEWNLLKHLHPLLDVCLSHLKL